MGTLSMTHRNPGSSPAALKGPHIPAHGNALGTLTGLGEWAEP